MTTHKPATPTTAPPVIRSVDLVTVAFDDAPWLVADPQGTFPVQMADAAFLQRIDAGEAFAHGDQMVCELMSREPPAVPALAIIRVLSHRAKSRRPK